MGKFRIEPHMRLQEWVAEELGLFRAEGLDYEFKAEGFASGSAGASVSPSGALEDMAAGRARDVSAACQWAGP